MKRKRWKLITLSIAAVLLAIVGAGAVVYQAARSAVERKASSTGIYIVNATSTTKVDLIREPEIRFESLRCSSDSWVEIEFVATYHAAPGESPIEINWLGPQRLSFKWGLRQWAVTNP